MNRLMVVAVMKTMDRGVVTVTTEETTGRVFEITILDDAIHVGTRLPIVDTSVTGLLRIKGVTYYLVDGEEVVIGQDRRAHTAYQPDGSVDEEQTVNNRIVCYAQCIRVVMSGLGIGRERLRALRMLVGMVGDLDTSEATDRIWLHVQTIEWPASSLLLTSVCIAGPERRFTLKGR